MLQDVIEKAFVCEICDTYILASKFENSIFGNKEHQLIERLESQYDWKTTANKKCYCPDCAFLITRNAKITHYSKKEGFTGILTFDYRHSHVVGKPIFVGDDITVHVSSGEYGYDTHMTVKDDFATRFKYERKHWGWIKHYKGGQDG